MTREEQTTNNIADAIELEVEAAKPETVGDMLQPIMLGVKKAIKRIAENHRLNEPDLIRFIAHRFRHDSTPINYEL